ncbi:MAG: hypothetical protein IPH18_00010 [Chitinophagaceae bacterium]|nr:hypothetical protein [Chitinophagaceae bacterium]
MKKFDDKLDTAVFTTKSIFNKSEVISYVFHHEEDGAWEFIGNSIYKEDDYIILSLREIIEIDKSVLEIADFTFRI